MADTSDHAKAKEARAEEKLAQAEIKARSGREAMAEYRARETAADDNANRLKALRLVRNAEAAAKVEEEGAPTVVPRARRTKAVKAPDQGLRPDQVTTENDG